MGHLKNALSCVGLTVLSWTGAVANAQPAEPPAAAPEPAAPEEPVATTQSAARATGNGLVSAFLAVGYAYSDSGFGVGARYQHVIAPEGLLKEGPTHDEVVVEGGIDYYRYNFGYNFGTVANSVTYNEVALTVGVAWNFWMLNEKLALYPKLDLSYRMGSFSSDDGTMSGYGGAWIQGTGGLVYRTSGVSLRAKLGSGSLRLGAGFTFL